MSWGFFFAQYSWQLGALLTLLLCSGFLSGSETALFSLSSAQLYRIRSMRAGGRIVAGLMSDSRSVLNTMLLGNLLVNIAFASISAFMVFDMAARGLSGWALAAGVVTPVVVLILMGEVAPKMLALRVSEQWSVVAAAPLAVITRVFSPVVGLSGALVVSPLSRLIAPVSQPAADITAEELGALLEVSAKRGVVDHDANMLLQEIVALTGINAAEIMSPRVDMVAYELSAPSAGLVELFKRTRLDRIPVYRGDLDHVAGVIHAKGLLGNPSAQLERLVVPVPFVPATANLDRLLLQFRAMRTQIAFVVDEYGGTAGVVTLRDLLEEIVGEIPEAFPRHSAAVERLGDREYVLDGDLSIHEWVEAFKMDLAERRVNTVGGFVTSLLGRIARVGDVARYRNLRFDVLSMRRRRIGKLRLELREDGA